MSKKTVLITGATGGLGIEFARLFAADGYDIILTARDESRLSALKESVLSSFPETEVYIIAKDLSQPSAAEEIFDYSVENKITVNALVNNAGFGDMCDYYCCDIKRQQSMMQVNIVALAELTRLFIAPMAKNGDGKIINVASAASLCAGPGMAVYYASKAFVRSFSEALYEEMCGKGVTVTALCPGPAKTGFEKAANLENSKMFSVLKPATAASAAKAGYKALMRGKPLIYTGIPIKLISFFTRFVPRSLSRKAAKRINH